MIDSGLIDRVFQPAADWIDRRFGIDNFAVGSRSLEAAVVLWIGWSVPMVLGNVKPDASLIYAVIPVFIGVDLVSDRVSIGKDRKTVVRAMLSGNPIVNPQRRHLVRRLAATAFWIAALAGLVSGGWNWKNVGLIAPVLFCFLAASIGLYFAACQPGGGGSNRSGRPTRRWWQLASPTAPGGA